MLFKFQNLEKRLVQLDYVFLDRKDDDFLRKFI